MAGMGMRWALLGIEHHIAVPSQRMRASYMKTINCYASHQLQDQPRWCLCAVRLVGMRTTAAGKDRGHPVRLLQFGWFHRYPCM